MEQKYSELPRKVLNTVKLENLYIRNEKKSEHRASTKYIERETERMKKFYLNSPTELQNYCEQNEKIFFLPFICLYAIYSNMFISRE